MRTIDLIAGARPNFMKIAPIVRALQRRRETCDHSPELGWRLVHTGQHWDRSMNDVFFEELGIPAPDERLGMGGGSHAEQTARVMTAYEQLCDRARPDCTVVVGDVNSTLACALVAAKLTIPLVHVEAGLRSGDRSMPEEINRLAVDAISNLFFVTEPSAVEHLLREGQPAPTIHEVGNVMVDNLFFQNDILESGGFRERDSPEMKSVCDFKRARAHVREGLGQAYAVLTLHRPSNVDDPETLYQLMQTFRIISRELPIAFPVHPRTRAAMDSLGIRLGSNIHLFPPLPYMPFLELWKHAAVVMTDSGGLQEETTALGIPCITVRQNTERPMTVSHGTNVLVGTHSEAIFQAVRSVRSVIGNPVNTLIRCPPLWDGQAANRIVSELARFLQ